VRYGDAVARKLIITLLVMALIGPMLLVWFFSLPAMVVLACCALIIPFRHVTMIACDPISSRFNLMLVAIGKALYLFGIAFAAGLIYGS
jgi:1,4-dihydroxy-2-naphthoate octaprenyltransferase